MQTHRYRRCPKLRIVFFIVALQAGIGAPAASEDVLLTLAPGDRFAVRNNTGVIDLTTIFYTTVNGVIDKTVNDPSTPIDEGLGNFFLYGRLLPEFLTAGTNTIEVLQDSVPAGY